MTEVSGDAIAVHKLLSDELRNDSTTVTFIGKYDNPDPEAVKRAQGIALAGQSAIGAPRLGVRQPPGWMVAIRKNLTKVSVN